MITVTIPVVLSTLALIVSYAAFQFGLFKWLVGRIDALGNKFQSELASHQQADLTAMKEIRQELLQLSSPKQKRKAR